MDVKRFTRENPHSHPMQKQTFHIPMNRVDDFEMKTFGGQTYMYGELVNKLGRYEELGEPEEIAKKMGRKI